MPGRYLITNHRNHKESTEPMFCFIGDRLPLPPLVGVYPGWTTFDASPQNGARAQALGRAVREFNIEVTGEDECKTAQQAQLLKAHDIALAIKQLFHVPVLRFKIDKPDDWQEVVNKSLYSLHPSLRYSIIHGVRMRSLYLDVFPVMSGQPYRDLDLFQAGRPAISALNGAMTASLWSPNRDPWKDFASCGLFDAMYKCVRSALRRKLPENIQASDLDDMAADVFATVTSEYAFRPTYSLLTLCKLKGAEVARKYRRRRPEKSVSDLVTLAGCVTPSGALAEERELRRRMIPVLEESVAQLPQALQTVLTMRFKENKPLEHIATALGISRSTTCARIARALDLLRKTPQFRKMTSDL